MAEEGSKEKPEKTDVLFKIFEKIKSSLETWVNQDNEAGISLLGFISFCKGV